MRTLICLLFVILPGVSYSQQQPTSSLDTLSRIDSVFASVTATGPGCVAGIGRDGQPPIFKAYGKASIEYNVSNSPITRFDGASMAKQFTAAAIAILAREGKLSVDDDVRRYLPRLPNYGKVISLRNLIEHTSGIRDQWDLLWLSGGHDDDATEDEDVLDLIYRQKALNFSPGTEFVYSNSGYTLLAQVVAKVSGVSLREFAKTRIFVPLGMTSTNFLDDRFEIQRGVATGYRHARSSAWSPSPYLNDTYGPGGLFTTVGDMLKWYSSFADTARIAHLRKSALPNGDSIPYAMGLDIGTFRRNRYAAHGGNDLGASAYAMRFLDRNFSVAVLCNARDIDSYTMARQLAGIFLPPAATAAAASATPSAPMELATTQLSRFAGMYFNPLTLAVRKVEVRNGKLVWARGNGTTLDAVAINRFRFPPGQPAELLFPEKQTGKVQEMHLISGSSVTIYHAAEPFKAPREGMKVFSGDFYSEELETTWHVAAGDSSVHVATLGSWGFDAQPILRDAFAVPDAVVVAFTRDKRGRIDGLIADMPRTRGVRFKRTLSR
ncbi:MAG TPA: serine hydrolase domain-containing protein [Gemmatimonadaceae bacterium]|nr:serine hydrolase domain-containing protein [Gemmatimonadaceae bacterium]